MAYDDRDPRYDDELPPRRPSRPRDDAPRSGGQPPRGRDDGYGPRSGQPSRARSGDTPPRSRASDDGYGPRSGSPSRPRSGETPPRSRSYDDYGQRSASPSRPRSGDTPSRGRSYDAYDDQGAQPSTRRRGDGAAGGGGARDMMRRVRDSFTGTFESMRAGGRRGDDRSATPSRSRRDDGYGRSAEWDDAPDRGYDDARAPARSSARAGGALPPANLTDRDGASRSLARRLIARRHRVREGGMPPGKRAFITSALAIFAIIIIVGGGFSAGYAYADTIKYNNTIMRLGLSQEANSSRIYDRHGTLLYQTLGQNADHRFAINYCQLPDVIKWATIDTEDHNFWNETSGIDPIGIARAFTSNASGGSTQGGSTITQQLVKLSVTGNGSRTLGRKIDEAILAVDVSQHYTRQDILTMYLNIVPYGFNNDGIEAAARAYFHLQPIDIPLDPGNPNYAKYQTPKFQAYVQQYTQCAKDQGIGIQNNMITMSAAWQLEPWQATLLAGTPNNPNTYNPYLHPVHATERQRDGVLIQMAKYGHGNYLTLPDGKGGEMPSDKDGVFAYTYKQITAVDAKGNNLYIFSNVFQGTGGLQELAPYFVEYVIDQLSQYFVNGREGFSTAGWNVYTTLDYGKTVSDQQLASIYIGSDGQITAKGYDPKKDHWLDDVGLQQYADYVTRRDINGGVTHSFPNYWYCANEAGNVISHDYNTNDNYFADTDSCLESPLDNDNNYVYDGATTAIDPRNGDILAMVGGVDYAGTGNTKLDGGQNNVVISDQRSMGSSFKPVVYATALEMGWTPGTVIRDQPTCFPVGGSTNTSEARPSDQSLCPGNYLPHNFEDASWAGPAPIRYLLSNSLNTPAELALSFVGMRADNATNISPIIPMAERLGITTLKPSDIGPATALGTQAVPLLQLTSAYGTFANAGIHMTPRAVLEVTNADGSPVNDGNNKALFPYVAQPAGYQAISPQTAYMLTSMLTDNNARIADFGPNNPLHFYGRDVAGKTGTSDAVHDIVTMGYTPWLALGVWDGNADGESMRNVIGITGAAYIFHDVMAYAIDRLKMPGTPPSRIVADSNPSPGGYFTVPTGLHRAILNCHTGLAPWDGQDVTNPKQDCNPPSQERVPAQMSPEFDYCSFAHPGKIAPPNPNETEKCAQKLGLDPSLNKTWDEWTCLAWGCLNQRVQVPGEDIVWVPDHQDPTAP